LHRDPIPSPPRPWDAMFRRLSTPPDCGNPQVYCGFIAWINYVYRQIPRRMNISILPTLNSGPPYLRTYVEVGASRMSTSRAEPFRLALAGLRDRLRNGVFRPGARIAATEVADTLNLSATPVREALSRLAGEGLLEDRRGQGFYLRALSGVEIADLFRMSLSQLLIAQDSHRAQADTRGVDRADGRESQDANPVEQVEQLFAVWVAQARSRTLSAAFRTLQIQLGPVRRTEPELIQDLTSEAEALQALTGSHDLAARGPALRRFHLRRVALADRLAVLVYRGVQSPKV